MPELSTLDCAGTALPADDNSRLEREVVLDDSKSLISASSDRDDLLLTLRDESLLLGLSVRGSVLFSVSCFAVLSVPFVWSSDKTVPLLERSWSEIMGLVSSSLGKGAVFLASSHSDCNENFHTSSFQQGLYLNPGQNLWHFQFHRKLYKQIIA